MSNEGLALIALGVGDAFSERYRSAALLLDFGGEMLAIDCPDRYRGALAEVSESTGHAVSLEQIDRFVITHVHGDHMNGLEAIAFYKHFVEGKRVRLITTPEIRSVIWERRLEVSMGTLFDGKRHRSLGFDDYFDFVPVRPGRAVRIGPFEVDIRETLHHVPSFALRASAGGRTLGYSGDTAFDPTLIAFLQDADLVIHETNLGPAHTPYEELARLPAELRDRMRLIHCADGFDRGRSAIPALREGELVRI